MGKPKKRKNVSQTIPNGTFIITNDKYFSDTDGKSNKIRMATTVDSNRDNEIALVKYTKSNRHGRAFSNTKGFKRHGDKIFSADENGQAIKIDGVKFIKGSSRRNISTKQANEIKKRNLKQSMYKNENIKALRDLKKR